MDDITITRVLIANTIAYLLWDSCSRDHNEMELIELSLKRIRAL